MTEPSRLLSKIQREFEQATIVSLLYWESVTINSLISDFACSNRRRTQRELAPGFLHEGHTLHEEMTTARDQHEPFVEAEAIVDH